MVVAAIGDERRSRRRATATPPASVLRSIGEGLRFVRRNQALMGSFAIDLMAMTFGMPRALFPVLAVSVYHAGAAGTGLLYAAVSVGRDRRGADDRLARARAPARADRRSGRWRSGARRSRSPG